MQPARSGDVSFWYADLGGLPSQRPALQGDTTADVCIIGAGYTGLWTAWYPKQQQPDLDVVVVEKRFAGYGASGRNGGWLSGGFAWNHRRYAETGGEAAVRAMVRAMMGTVDEVIRVAEDLGPLPADPIPDLGRQRLGHDLRRVERQPVALRAGQGGGEALCAAQDRCRTDTAVIGGDQPGGKAGDGGALDDAHALALDRSGKAPDELCRLHPRHARDDHAA